MEMKATSVTSGLVSVLLAAAMAWSCAAWGQSSIHFGQKVQPAPVPRLEAVFLKLAARGDKVALIYVHNTRVRRIWYYNVKTRHTMLTYKRR